MHFSSTIRCAGVFFRGRYKYSISCNSLNFLPQLELTITKKTHTHKPKRSGEMCVSAIRTKINSTAQNYDREKQDAARSMSLWAFAVHIHMPFGWAPLVIFVLLMWPLEKQKTTNNIGKCFDAIIMYASNAFVYFGLMRLSTGYIWLWIFFFVLLLLEVSSLFAFREQSQIHHRNATMCEMHCELTHGIDTPRLWFWTISSTHFMRSTKRCAHL